MISKRAQRGLDTPALCNHQDRLYDNDPYHAVKNPNGYIKLSSADNTLSADLVAERFHSLDWAKLDTNQLLTYPRIGGEQETLKIVASFVNEYCRKGFEPMKADEVGVCAF